jgi:hypothetical protein
MRVILLERLIVHASDDVNPRALEDATTKLLAELNYQGPDTMCPGEF